MCNTTKNTIKENKMSEIAKAIIQFHNEVGKVAKNSTNPYFKSKYGDLNAYLEVIKQPLANAGLAMVQMPITNGLKTILMHTSGEKLESECTIPELTTNCKNKSQDLGSAITYLRRYMLASFLGLNAEDDDGQSAKPENTMNLQKKASLVYNKIKKPSDELKQWVSALPTHTGDEIVKGMQRMEQIIQKEQTK
jgi:hypothetical protein